jgi:integrase
MLGIKRPSYEAPGVPALAPAQIRAFLKAAEGGPLEALYVLTIFTGLRSGEVLALRWRDVDLKAGVLMVSSSLRDTGAKKADKKPSRVIDSPKIAKSARLIALPKVAAKALAQHRKRTVVDAPDALVFPNERGRPLWRQNLLRRSFYPLLERAGLVDAAGEPLLSFHDLRHVHGTELFRAGVHPKVVQERLGHSRVSVTLDTYSSSVPGMQESAVRSIDRSYPASTAYATRRATRGPKKGACKVRKKPRKR